MREDWHECEAEHQRYLLTIQPMFNDLVVATHGRGFWILDDITPLRAMNAHVRNADVHLFEPRSAYYRLSTDQPLIGKHRRGADVDGTGRRCGARVILRRRALLT